MTGADIGRSIRLFLVNGTPPGLITVCSPADRACDPRQGREWRINAQGRLLSTLLVGMAEFERELIRERTGEGRKRALDNGVKFGRKRKLSD